MRSVSTDVAPRATEMRRTIVRGPEQMFGRFSKAKLARVAEALWPEKTAVFLADRAECSVRAAELYLGGQRKWSGEALGALISEILD